VTVPETVAVHCPVAWLNVVGPMLSPAGSPLAVSVTPSPGSTSVAVTVKLSVRPYRALWGPGTATTGGTLAMPNGVPPSWVRLGVLPAVTVMVVHRVVGS